MSGVSGGGGNRVLIARQEIGATVAQVDFTGIPYNAFRWFELHMRDVVPVLDGSEFHMRLGTDPSGFHSGASDYAYSSVVHNSSNTTISGSASNARNVVEIAQNIGTHADDQFNGVIRFLKMAGGRHKAFEYRQIAKDSFSRAVHLLGTGILKASTEPIDRVRFLSLNGDLAAGDFRLYGLRG